jgi:hypothetical protein
MATVLINNNTPVFTKSIERVSFSNTRVTQEKRGVSVESVLPFRIKFTAINIPNSIANVPAIPLQIIGFSNYIL